MVLASHLSWKNIVEMLLVYSLLLFSLFLPWTGTAMLLQISMSKNDIFHYTLYIYIPLYSIMYSIIYIRYTSLRQKCPYSEFFWSTFSRI